jgi:predicted MFS family arabinose efflux permease
MAEFDTNTDNDRLAKRNVAILAYAQAVLGSQMAIHIILGGLAGSYLASDQSLATLPISMTVLVSMFTAPAASLFMGRFGRRAGFLLGTFAGAVGGALNTWALIIGSFELLLLGSACTGIYQSFQGFFRFAAADTATEGFKPKAISWVLAGGLASAIIGPEVVHFSSDLFAPVPFAGAFAVVVVINLVGAAGLTLLRIPVPPKPAKGASSGRSLREIFRQPTVVVAVLCAMVSFAMMSLVMTSTPLAMVQCGFTPGHAADVVRFHVLAMFAPSFVTGSLIVRYGHGKIIATGLALLGSCGIIALAGIELANFYVALIALGIGWNFGFIGATSLLATAHTSAERAKVQGLNDFLVFGLVAAASFSSGALLNGLGWEAVHYAMIPALTVAALSLAWLAYRQGKPKSGRSTRI